ncbi:MAG: cell division protein FtsA [Bacteroidales bacterium]|nr:cell division protein FtsA [Bacteroidales bacterium]
MESQEVKFTEKDRIVVGIDIGTTKVVCLIGKKNSKGDIEILGKGKTTSIGVLRGDVINVDKTANSIKEAVEQAEAQSGYKVKEVFVGIAGFNIHTEMNKAYLEIPDENHIISKEDIDKLVEEQYNLKLEPGQRIIDVIPQSFKVDGMSQDLAPDLIVGVRGKKIECNYKYITADVNNIRNIQQSVLNAGYVVKDLILQPICSAEAVIDKSEKDAGICLVDIGGGTTDVAIYHKGLIRYTSVIQLAGNIITKDIEEACRIVEKQANALKEQYGDCITTKQQELEIICIPSFRKQEAKEITKATLTRVISYRVKDILEQVLYDIKQSGYEKNLIAGIVLTGGGAKITNISQLTEYVTDGISTRIGMPTDYLAKGSQFTKELEHPMYATVVGLLIKGFEWYEEHEPIKQEPIATPKEEPVEIIDEEPKEIPNEKPEKRKKESEKTGFGEKIKNLLSGIITDGIE